MNSFVAFFVAGCMLAGGIAGQGDPTVNFDCNRIPNVCDNMCYGAYCSDHGDGTVGVSLIYDDPSDDVENARRNEACGNVACTAEETCDEYPFASTSDADIEDRYARCVPAVPFNENSSQGATLGNFYRTVTALQAFIVTFGNPGATRYCSYPPDCTNDDGREFRNGQVADPPTNLPGRRLKRGLTRHYYRTESGIEVLGFAELPIGKRLFSTTLNEKLMSENRRLEKRDPLAEHERQDEIIAEHLYSI